MKTLASRIIEGFQTGRFEYQDDTIRFENISDEFSIILTGIEIVAKRVIERGGKIENLKIELSSDHMSQDLINRIEKEGFKVLPKIASCCDNMPQNYHVTLC